MRVCVLMPTYNEMGPLTQTVEAVVQVAPNLDLLIIDDNSPDGTGNLADLLANKHPQLRVLHRQVKQGLGRAYIAGFEWAIENGYDYIVQMDADGSHRPDDLPLVVGAAAENRLVIGSRWVPGGAVLNWPWYRQWISRAGNLYARLTLRSHVKDITAGFRCYPVSFLTGLELEQVRAQGYGFQIEMTKLAQDSGAVVEEVPITFVERESGVSKMTYKIIFEAFWLCTKWAFRR